MLRELSMAAATMLASGAASADPIEGSWKTQGGETAMVTSCGDGFCITLTTGKHAGTRIGRISAAGDGSYTGSITDPEDKKTYKGRAWLSGNTAKLSGCMLGGMVCKSQDWTKP